MGIGTWIAVAVIVVAVIGLGAGVFFGGLLRGVEIIGENPTVQNATEEAGEIAGEVETQISSFNKLEITTDKPTYAIGEPVLVTVKNDGNRTLTFSDSSLGLQIQDVETGTVYSLTAAQVVTELQSGESKSLTWDQRDGDGMQVDSGEYMARVHTIVSDATADTRFEIK